MDKSIDNYNLYFTNNTWEPELNALDYWLKNKDWCIADGFSCILNANECFLAILTEDDLWNHHVSI